MGRMRRIISKQKVANGRNDASRSSTGLHNTAAMSSDQIYPSGDPRVCLLPWWESIPFKAAFSSFEQWTTFISCLSIVHLFAHISSPLFSSPLVSARLLSSSPPLLPLSCPVLSSPLFSSPLLSYLLLLYSCTSLLARR
mmetsp:Transcript_32502/g.73041  ORF Transcript_32502/g.73041 Transcript_32502/m.73041 type:complete len:139 (+) Transcript_32502:2751-3167(+)